MQLSPDLSDWSNVMFYSRFSYTEPEISLKIDEIRKNFNAQSQMRYTSLLTDIPAHLLDYLGSTLKSITANVSLIQNHFHGSNIFWEFKKSNHVTIYYNMLEQLEYSKKKGSHNLTQTLKRIKESLVNL